MASESALKIQSEKVAMMIALTALKFFDALAVFVIVDDIARLYRADQRDPTKLPRAIARWLRKPR